MDITLLQLPGETQAACARRLGVPLTTLRGWRNSQPSDKYKKLVPALTTSPTNAPSRPPMESLLTPSQAARLAGVSPATIRLWIHRGTLKARAYPTPSGRRSYRIPETNLKTLLEEQ